MARSEPDERQCFNRPLSRVDIGILQMLDQKLHDLIGLHAAIRHQSERPQGPDLLRVIRRLRSLQQIFQALRNFSLIHRLPVPLPLPDSRTRMSLEFSAAVVRLAICEFQCTFPAIDPRVTKFVRPRQSRMSHRQLKQSFCLFLRTSCDRVAADLSRPSGLFVWR